MSLERVRAQLGKFGLAKPNDEMAVTVQSLSPYYLFSDSIGETFLIARADDVEQRLNAISYNMGKLTYEQFWSGVWLGRVPHYRGFDELWESLAAEPFTVSVSVPKASERLYIGRAKKLNKGIWLLESESGEYGLVPEQEAQKWYLE